MLSTDQCGVFPDSGAAEDYRTEADFTEIHTSGRKGQVCYTRQTSVYMLFSLLLIS